MVHGPDGIPVCIVGGFSDAAAANREARIAADAQLIAAAPEMLAALRAVLDAYESARDSATGAHRMTRELSKIRHAIQRAEGR